jgi:serine/threonine-protein kinase
MGEVYRARDTKLGREVALKIVLDSVTHDPERRARFQREAQLLASLNHPHIATIHGLEQSGSTQFLVMELVDGATLAERLKGGALPVGEALTIARQMAEALQAAHEKGIIHRDLKPANIALTADGQVKVLDFGLAKALDDVGRVLPSGPAGSKEQDPAYAAANSPTLSMAATQAGMILGTAAYMSPEQAKGKVADKRSDVWAFGCVFYEMLTGRRAFEGEDASDTMAAVLRAEPDWTALPAAVPPMIRTLVQRCLAKDRQHRVADISAALFILTAPLDAPAIAASTAPTRRLRGWRLPLVLATACAVASAATALAMLFLRPAPALRVSRLAVAAPAPAGLMVSGNDRDVAISPDGSRLAYVGVNGIVYVRALDRLDPVALPGLGSPRGLFFSPDGEWLGFFEGGSGTIKKVAVTGGPPIVVSRVAGNGRGATWMPDGTIVFATNDATGLMRVSEGGGEPTVVTTPDRGRGEGDHLWPERSPDGRTLLFTITSSTGTNDASEIAALDVSTLRHTVLFKGGTDGHYLDDGRVVYAAGGTLRAVRVDLNAAGTGSAPAVVLPELVVTTFGAGDFDVSLDGTLVYVPGGAQAVARTLVWVDRQGREEAINTPARAYQYTRLSPDGRRVALDVRDQENDIWIWSFPNGPLQRLTFNPAPDRFPVWTHDGRRVIFGSDAGGGASNLYWQAADGTGGAERLTENRILQFPMTVGPDGKELVFRENNQVSDLLVLPLVGERRPRPLVVTPFAEQNAEISPDGRWMAYESNDSGQFEVFVRPYPNVEGGRWQVSTGGGSQPLWARSGSELFYLAATGDVMGVGVDRGAVWSAGASVKLFGGGYYHGGGAGGGAGRTYDVSLDAQRFLMIKQGGDASTSGATLVVVQNWFEELKRLVPGN